MRRLFTKVVVGAYLWCIASRVVAKVAFFCAISTVFSACSRSKGYYRERDTVENRQERSDRSDRLSRSGVPKRRILILPFMNMTPYTSFSSVGGSSSGPKDLGEYVSQRLEQDLMGVPGLMVATSVSKARSDDFFMGDQVRVQSLVREGRRLGISLIALGRIKKVLYRQKGDPVGLLRQRKSLAGVELELRLYDTTEGRELILLERLGDTSAAKFALFTKDEQSEEDHQEARASLIQEAVGMATEELTKALDAVAQKLSWEGRIAKISGQQVYINAGRRSGLFLGDILKVVSWGDDLFDPVTGQYLGRARGAVKGTLEVMDYIGPDAAMARVHSGAGFAENDLVQLY